MADTEDTNKIELSISGSDAYETLRTQLNSVKQDPQNLTKVDITLVYQTEGKTDDDSQEEQNSSEDERNSDESLSNNSGSYHSAYRGQRRNQVLAVLLDSFENNEYLTVEQVVDRIGFPDRVDFEPKVVVSSCLSNLYRRGCTLNESNYESPTERIPETVDHGGVRYAYKLRNHVVDDAIAEIAQHDPNLIEE